MKKSHHNSKTNHKNLISRWVRVTIWYKLFSWSKIPRKKFFHKNFLMREFSPSDIWIDVFRKFCCDINKYHICLVIVYFGECTWPVAFERTHLQGLTHSRSWDIWIDVHVVFRWFQPYYILYSVFEYLDQIDRPSVPRGMNRIIVLSVKEWTKGILRTT